MGFLLMGWLGTKKLYAYRPQLLSITYILRGISLYVAYSSETLSSSLAGLSDSAFFLFGGIGIVYALAADLAPVSSRGTYWGAVSTIRQISGIIAPWTIGQLVKLTGTFASRFTMMAASLVAAALCVVFLILFVREGAHRQSGLETLPDLAHGARPLAAR